MSWVRSERHRGMLTCYWAIAHSGSKIAAQPNTDNEAIDIIAARGESGRSPLVAASSDATE